MTETGASTKTAGKEDVTYGEEVLSQGLVQDALRADVVHDKLKQIQSNSLRKLLERQNALVERLEKLSELPNMAEAERQKSIIESELRTVREEYSKRQEDVGVLAHELFALYDELGMQSKFAGEDKPEDIAKRQEAKDAIVSVEKSISHLETELEKAIENKAEAESSWWPFGKQAKVNEAASRVDNLKSRIHNEKDRLKEAQENIAVVEEQIQVDKRERVRKASLAENFSLIREFTRNAASILKADIEETAQRASSTEKALNSALDKKRVTARSLDDLRDKMEKTERDLQREINALSEIPDQGSSAYAEQQKVVADLEASMTKMKGEELKLNTTHMAMTQAIEANKSSLAGLTMQHDTAEVYLIKLTNAEKTAEILGRNIDRMTKNTMQETASDALDRVNDSMVMTAVDLGVQAEVASGKVRNDALERHNNLMEQLHETRKAGDQAVAVEAARYIEIDKRIRKGYTDRGIDLDMSNLDQAARMFSSKEAAEEASGGEITY